MIEVRKMSAAEISEYREMAMEHLAREEAEAYERPLEEMRVSARKAFDSLLPDGGAAGPDQHLYSLWANEQSIGYVWISLRGDRKQIAYILDFYLHPGMRGKGYGTEAFAAVENHTRKLGAESISLNVFRHNTVAVHLYEKIGFRVVSYMMAKTL
jgi:ribosomal protein S18 acetylase RimI-like enzyme